MITGYYPRIRGRWTAPIENYPRWVAANGYPDLFDRLIVPPIGAPALSWPAVGSGSPAPPTLPTGLGWTHTEASAGSGSLLQSFWEGLVNEEMYILPPLTQISLQSTLNVDEAEPAFAWILEYPFDIEKVEIKLDNNSWLEIAHAIDELDLFYSGKRGWRQDARTLIIANLDILQTSTQLYQGWHYMDPDLLGDERMVWLQHPDSKNWIPLHPTRVRTDGFLGFYSDSSIQLRVRIPTLAAPLTTITVRLNGEILTEARCVNLRTSLDDAGLWCRLERFELETNSSFLQRLEASQWFCRTQNKNSCRNYLSIALGTAIFNTIPKTSTTVSLASGHTGFSIKGMEQTVYALEVGLIPNQETAGTYRTLLASPELGIGFLRQQDVEIEVDGNGVVTPQTGINDNKLDNLTAMWKLRLWSVGASSISFTDNYRQIEDLTMLTTTKVDVVDPSEDTLKRSFDRNSPTRRWHRYDVGETKIKGLARFD